MSDHLPEIHYLNPELLQKIGGFLNEFPHKREATLGGGSAGPPQ